MATLTKDGITVTVADAAQVAQLESMGYEPQKAGPAEPKPARAGK